MQEVLTESKPENLEDEDKDDSWEDLTGEIEKEENCEAPKDSTTRNQQPVEGITALQRLPSFEVLAEYPLPTVKDFVKVRENVFTQQQTTFAFGNLTTDACPLVGFKRKVHKNTKWLANSSDKKPTIKIQKKAERKQKHRRLRSGDFIVSTSGLMLALFATNVLTFVLGFSLGWWSRDSVPTLAVYEFHLDPTLL